jgi:mono/diheme cytochrome c family protein
MKYQSLLVALVVVSTGCGGLLGVENPDDGGTGGGSGFVTGGGSSTTGGGSATGGGGGAVASDLPCDVATLLSESCASCHNGTGGVVRLMTRADFAAPSALDPQMNFGQRAVLRMRATAGAMPPAPAAPVTSAKVDAFEAWVTGGFAAGSCQANTDGGAEQPDAGPIVPHDGGIAGLPCDVSAFVATKCASCHGSPATHGASFALLTREDFLAPSPSYAGVTLGARSGLRIHATSNPMPPVGSPAATATEVAAFDGWLTAGMPVGTCGAIDAGVPDAGPAPTTCTSNSYWTGGNSESPNMNPGVACLTCHRTQAPSKAYPYSGTVFPSLHEKDRCNSRAPSGVKVEILNANGTVAITMYASTTSGNFNSSRYPTVTLPYTARVTYGGRTATMTTPQTNGDCNSCHTEQGNSGASGRIVWP